MNDTIMMMVSEIRHLQGQVNLLRAQVGAKAEGSVVKVAPPMPADATRTPTRLHLGEPAQPSERMSPMPSWSTGDLWVKSSALHA